MLNILGDYRTDSGKHRRKIKNLYGDLNWDKQADFEKDSVDFHEYFGGRIFPTSFPRKSNKIKFSKSNTLKDHFLIINHKNESVQTIFQPKSYSTPVKNFPKTSTPKKFSNSYFENIFSELGLIENYNKPIKLKISFDSNNNLENNKHSDYFSLSTHEDENEYDLPKPRTIENEYQIPNTVFYTPLIKSISENLVKETIAVKHDLYISSNPNENSRSTESNKDETLNLTKISTLSSQKLERKESFGYIKSDSMKNYTVISNASSVSSSVIKCCIKPFKVFYQSNKVKKNLKKL